MEQEDDPLADQVEKLAMLLKPFVVQVARTSGEPAEEEDIAKYAETWTAGVGLAWLFALGAAADQSEQKLLASDQLDDALLPMTVPDLDKRLVGFSGGLVGAEFIREVLRLCKASLPAGQALPEPVCEILRDDSIEIR